MKLDVSQHDAVEGVNFYCVAYFRCLLGSSYAVNYLFHGSLDKEPVFPSF